MILMMKQKIFKKFVEVLDCTTIFVVGKCGAFIYFCVKNDL